MNAAPVLNSALKKLHDDAYLCLEVEAGCEPNAIKKAYRAKAKEVHPDVKPGDEEAAEEFQKLHVAYEVLRSAEERREWKG